MFALKFPNPIAEGVRRLFLIERKPPKKLEGLISVSEEPPAEPLFLKQVHGGAVHFINSLERANNAVGAFGDGFITTLKNIPISVHTADCIPLILASHDGEAVGVIHCSWRSTATGIIENAISLIKGLGVNPDALLCEMGPAIAVENYEVGPEVAQKFPESVTEKGNGKFALDLPAEVARRLVLCGVARASVVFPPYSTYTTDWLPSYRREGNKAGRIATVAWLE